MMFGLDINFRPISGVMLGIEFDTGLLILDLLILRIIIHV